MIVRSLEEIADSDRNVRAPTFESRRFLLAGDGTPFSLHDTLLYAGTETLIWYRHHLEAVYCMDGTGEVTLLDSDERIPIRPGTMYALNGHERHLLRAETDLRMLCVFTPALTGREVHDEDGVYPLLTEDGAATEGIARA